MGKRDQEGETIIVVGGRRVYTEELKHLICKEHVQGGLTLRDLVRKYNLSSHSLVHEWLRQLGYLPSRPGQVSRSVQIGVENYHKVTVQNNLPYQDRAPDPEESEIARLKRELHEAQIKAEGYRRMIEVAEEELKIPIRKKSSTK